MPLKEANVPEHRWYQKRYNARLARDDYSKDWIYPSGLRRIDEAFMRAEGYMVSNHAPKTMADFKNGVYVVDGIQTTFSAAFQHTRNGNATMTGDYGPELVTNGSFDSDTGWTLNANGGTEHSISNGKFISTNSADLRASTLGATGLIEQNGVYEITVVVRSITSGSFRVMAYSDTNYGGTPDIDTEGVHKFQVEITASGTAYLNNFVIQTRTAGSTFEIDNISVREVPKIQWAPHNLLTYSEDFSSVAWTKTATDVTPNAAVAPDGTQTADKISHTSTSSSFLQTTSQVSGAAYKFGIFIKSVDHQWVRIVHDGSSVWVDTTNIVVGTDNMDEPTSVLELTDGWLYIVVSNAYNGASSNVSILLADGDNSATESSGTSAYIWGAHLYRSDLGGMADVPASERVLPTATKYVRTAGREVTGTELVTNGTFDTDSDWTKGTGWTISGGVASQSGTGGSNLYQTGVFPSAGTYAITFTVSNHSAGSLYLGHEETTALLEGATSNGTYTVYMTVTSTQTDLYLNSTGGGLVADVDNISVKEIDVNPAAARYLPRVNHHAYNGSQWVNKGLFVESEARTNLVTHSDFSSNWTAGGTTLTANNAAGLDGNTSAATLVEDGSAGQHKLQSSVTVSSGVTYTWSLVVKANGRSAFSLYPQSGTAASAKFDLDAAVSTDDVTTNLNGHGIHLIAPDKYLCWITFTTTGTTVLPHIYLRDSAAAASAPSYTGDGVSGLIIEATQLEAGSTPSSYLPTNGATVTRPAETLTIPAANLPWPNPVYVTGEELVTNGTFDTDTTGWSLIYSGTPLSVVNGVLRVTEDGVDGSSARAYQAITCEVGKVYRASVYMPPSSQSAGLLAIGTSGGAYGGRPQATVTSGNTTVLDFVADATTLYVQLVNSGTSADYSDFDNISVKEINPLALSIQMSGEMTYADEGAYNQIYFARWRADANNYISLSVNTYLSQTGQPRAFQAASGVIDIVDGGTTYYSPDINVPFNISSRHGSTFINGAVDGVALTADTTPVALPDLENTDLDLAYDFMGTISLFRMWANDLGDTGIEEATEPSTQATLFLSFDGSNNSYVDFDWSE